MMNHFETYFDANYTYYATQTVLGLFENLAFGIVSTGENMRLIARASFDLLTPPQGSGVGRVAAGKIFTSMLLHS